MQVACGRKLRLNPENRRMGRGRGWRERFAVLRSSAGTSSRRVRGQGRSGREMSVGRTRGGLGKVIGVDPWTLVEPRMVGIGVERGDGRGVGRRMF